MDRKFYLDLAAAGLRMPIGTDMVLHEKPDHKDILRDGPRLGRLLEEVAVRYATPLAIPIMDLALERSALLRMLGVPDNQVDTFHFTKCPCDQQVAAIERHLNDPLDVRMRANVEAIGYIAAQTKLLPVGMAIGPFSLMTKLLADPITPLYTAGMGVTPEEDEEVRMVAVTLELATEFILRSVSAQIDAGAKAVFIAEPAASKAYISPNQINDGSDIFDRYVMHYNQQIRELLRSRGVDLIFHCCGELTDYMLGKFNELDAAMMSLGSSRKLWEDARLISNQTVLYGNLPSKKFYSDDVLSAEEVSRMSGELLRNMRKTGHPFILGTECDVLSVPGREREIKSKIAAMLECRAD